MLTPANIVAKTNGREQIARTDVEECARAFTADCLGVGLLAKLNGKGGMVASALEGTSI